MSCLLQQHPTLSEKICPTSRLGKEAAPKGGSSSRFAVSHNPVADSDASRRFVQKHGLPERAAPAAELAAPAAHEVFTQPLPSSWYLPVQT